MCSCSSKRHPGGGGLSPPRCFGNYSFDEEFPRSRSKNVILFGATGMVGQGVLRECLQSPEVESILSIVRRPTGRQHPKLRQIATGISTDFSAIEQELTGFDACFFCLGVSSLGMSARDYERVTYDFTLSAARTLARRNPSMTFVYVSGAGTDSSEHGSTRWARVKAAPKMPSSSCLSKPPTPFARPTSSRCTESWAAARWTASPTIGWRAAPLPPVEELLLSELSVTSPPTAGGTRHDPRRPAARRSGCWKTAISTYSC